MKEALALARAGAEVHVRGVMLNPAWVPLDRALLSPAFSFDYVGSRSAVARLRRGLARRVPALRLPERFGAAPLELRRAARALRPDLVIAHSEAALWAAEQLAGDGLRVGVDLEDWFSQDLTPEARASRPVAELESLEGALLRRGAYRLTTSKALASALAAHHGVEPPGVVRNVFPLGSEPRIESAPRLRVHWFSQTIGPGRGLELLFRALPSVSGPVEVHLRGMLYDRYKSWLEAQIPPGWRDRVAVHDPVPNAALHDAIGAHDVGLALETRSIPSRDLTITNKFFQYLAGGLAVVATRTAGQCEAMAEAPGAGVLVGEDPAELAEALNALAAEPGRTLAMRRAAREAARERLCWEHEEARLLAEFTKARG